MERQTQTLADISKTQNTTNKRTQSQWVIGTVLELIIVRASVWVFRSRVLCKWGVNRVLCHHLQVIHHSTTK